MKRILFFCVCLGLHLPSAYAKGKEAADVKKAATFAMESGARNPFWPIGWRPAGEGEQVGPEIPANVFVVSSITLDPNPAARFVILNGKTMMEGQQFGLQMNGQTYQIKLVSIEDGQIVLQRRDEKIIVPLRRK